ncbi:hypothetical protein [Halocynthiibacter sp.]|uniref:hypothetical protein n=1 Tax=Halocynthiibacter sp. TaxID=1979210 RepID=UPI003C5A49B1
MAPAKSTSNDGFIQLVGKLNHEWTRAEGLLIHLIAGLSKTDLRTAAIFFQNQSGASNRLELVRQLSEQKVIPPAEREDILTVVKRLQGIRKKRNQLSHCLYSFDPSAEIKPDAIKSFAHREEHSIPEQATARKNVMAATKDLQRINKSICFLMGEYGYPA